MSDVPFQPPAPTDVEQSENIRYLKELYPGICQVLMGRTKEMRGGVFPASSIILSLDGDVLKFCVTPKYGAHVAFGTIQDVTDILTCLDVAIRTGKVDWRPRKTSR